MRRFFRAFTVSCLTLALAACTTSQRAEFKDDMRGFLQGDYGTINEQAMQGYVLKPPPAPIDHVEPAPQTVSVQTTTVVHETVVHDAPVPVSAPAPVSEPIPLMPPVDQTSDQTADQAFAHTVKDTPAYDAPWSAPAFSQPRDESEQSVPVYAGDPADNMGMMVGSAPITGMPAHSMAYDQPAPVWTEIGTFEQTGYAPQPVEITQPVATPLFTAPAEPQGVRAGKGVTVFPLDENVPATLGDAGWMPSAVYEPVPAAFAPPVLDEPAPIQMNDIQPVIIGGRPVQSEQRTVSEQSSWYSRTYSRETMQFFFADGSNIVQPSDRARLKALAQEVRANRLHLKIIGHSNKMPPQFDGGAGERTSLAMSQKRAEAVASILRAEGIPDAMMAIEAAGDTQPNLSPAIAGLSQPDADRRVEIAVGR